MQEQCGPAASRHKAGSEASTYMLSHSHVLTFHIHFDDLLKGHIKTCTSHTYHPPPKNKEKFKCQPDLQFTFSRRTLGKITMKSPLTSVVERGIFHLGSTQNRSQRRPTSNSRSCGRYCDCFSFKIKPIENTMTAKHATMLHAAFESSWP